MTIGLLPDNLKSSLNDINANPAIVMNEKLS